MGWNIIYLDETYIQVAHLVEKCWQSNHELGFTKKIRKKNRPIIVHADGEEGFVKDACLIFKYGGKVVNIFIFMIP